MAGARGDVVGAEVWCPVEMGDVTTLAAASSVLANFGAFDLDAMNGAARVTLVGPAATLTSGFAPIRAVFGVPAAGVRAVVISIGGIFLIEGASAFESRAHGRIDVITSANHRHFCLQVVNRAVMGVRRCVAGERCWRMLSAISG